MRPTLARQNERFEESVEKATREGKDIGHTLAVVEKAGSLTIEEEDAVRQRLSDLEEAEEKEQANDRIIEDKIKVNGFVRGYTMPNIQEIIFQYVL